MIHVMGEMNPNRRAVLQLLGGAALGSLLPLCPLLAEAAGAQPTRQIPVWQMPEALWTLMEQAQAIQTGGKPGADAQIQVIIDVNCPYCARTYARFHEYYPELAVRWVPINDLLPDGGAIADAMLRSKDPVASLNQNFLSYDYAGIRSHGGFALPHDGRNYALPKANRAVQRSWAKWSGRTPTFVFRDRERRIAAIADSSWEVIRYVVSHVYQPLGAYTP